MEVNYSSKQIKEEVLNSLSNKKPLFMLRMGDGEMILANYSKNNSTENDTERLIKFSKKQIGRGLTNDEIIRIQINLINSVLKCNILGLPTKKHIIKNSLWSDLITYYKKIKDNNPINWIDKNYCTINSHFELVNSGDLFEIFESIDKIVIVSCRDIKDRIKERFPNINHIEQYLIPGEQVYEEVLNNNVDIFEEIDKITKNLSSVDRSGQLLIFGAGSFGKHLGFVFSELNGVSLDLGSVFDFFVGKVTRGPNKSKSSYIKPVL